MGYLEKIQAQKISNDYSANKKDPSYLSKIKAQSKLNPVSEEIPQSSNIPNAIGRFFTGSTQDLGKTTGEALAAPGNEQKYSDVLGKHTDIQNNLLKAIQAKKALGQNTSKLENALHEHTQSAPKLEDFTGDIVNKSAGSVLGEGLGTAVEVASLGSFGPALQGAKDVVKGAGFARDLAESGKLIEPLIKGKSVPTVVSGAEKLIGKAGELPAIRKEKFIADLITPELTKKEGINAIKTGKVAESKGLFGARNITESIPNFEEIKSAVKEIPGIKKGNTFLENHNLIEDAIGNTADELKTALKTQDITAVLNKSQWDKYLKGVKTTLKANPILVGDSEQTAARILDHFQTLLPKGDITAIDLLEARQKLDKWIKGFKGAGIFDPKLENAISTVLRPIRQGANDLIAEIAPDVKVKDLLRKQTNLFNASDVVAEKANKEAATKLGRIGNTRTGRVIRALAPGIGTALGVGLGVKAVSAATK